MGGFHSIHASGMAIFDHPIESIIGGVVIDLASAPLAPGAHRLRITAGVGGIEIYLPRYVTFTVEGGAAIGGQDIHDGPGLWTKLTHRVSAWLHLPNQVPLHAVEDPHPGQPTSIVLAVDGVVGGLDIYRL